MRFPTVDRSDWDEKNHKYVMANKKRIPSLCHPWWPQMQSAALLRVQLEASLAERAPSAFTLRTRQVPELLPTGTPELDALLGGGIPRGNIAEITGASTTGRTSLALSILARAIGQGAVCAWVDVQDALDPETASAYGVQLERLLWLRTLIEGILTCSTAIGRGCNNVNRNPLYGVFCRTLQHKARPEPTTPAIFKIEYHAPNIHENKILIASEQ